MKRMEDAIRNPVLEAKALSKRFTEGQVDEFVLSDVALHVDPGETLAILGEAGSGKSTLMHLLGGMDQPSTGSVKLKGKEFGALAAAEQGRMRNRHLGFIYEFPHLLPEFSVADNVAMPLTNRGQAGADSSAERMLELVGLKGRGSQLPSQLTAAEKQRVAVARAMVTLPDCVLADEPTRKLGPGAAEEIFGLFQQLARSEGVAFVVATQEPALAALCDRKLVLDEGTLRPPR